MIDFDGPVQCRRDRGAVNLVLQGRERGAEGVEALFAGASADALGELPPTLHEVRLAEVAPPLYRLSAREVQMDLEVRSLQVHRDVAREFFSAVPPPHVPLGRRLGWTVLLWLLRIPGAESLLVRLRGRS